jgi:hypothetical protein
MGSPRTFPMMRSVKAISLRDAAKTALANISHDLYSTLLHAETALLVLIGASEQILQDENSI